MKMKCEVVASAERPGKGIETFVPKLCRMFLTYLAFGIGGMVVTVFAYIMLRIGFFDSFEPISLVFSAVSLVVALLSVRGSIKAKALQDSFSLLAFDTYNKIGSSISRLTKRLLLDKPGVSEYRN